MKAVIFDNDGVLVNSEETAFLNDPPFLRQFGLEYTPAEYAAVMSGKTRADLLKKMNEDCLAHSGKALPAEFPEKLLANYRHQVAHILSCVKGADILVRSLKAAHIPIAVASNGEHESMKRKLEKAGLYNEFLPHVYNKDDSGGAPKPAPDVYLYAMKKLGVTNPADCIVIEDSPTGIQSGKAAGMYVIGYCGGQHRQPGYDSILLANGADIVVDTMEKAGKIIYSLCAPAKQAVKHP